MSPENESKKPDTKKDDQKVIIPATKPSSPDHETDFAIKRKLSGDSTTKPPIPQPDPPKKEK